MTEEVTESIACLSSMRRFKAPSFIRRDDNVGSKAQEGDGNSLARNDAAVGSQGSKCGSRSAMIATPKPQLTDKENVKTQTQNVARHYAVLYTKRAPNKVLDRQPRCRMYTVAMVQPNLH